jgi:hypothetical protein
MYDIDGIAHTVEVTAGSLYEAVALGMAAIRSDEWASGIAQGLNPVTVQVSNVPVKHEVRLMDFTKWLDKTNGDAARDNGAEKGPPGKPVYIY